MKTTSDKNKRKITNLAPRSLTGWQAFLYQWRRSPAAIFGTFVLLMLVVSALGADVIAPYGPTEGAFEDARKPPMWAEGGSPDHILGTDRLGQDLFSRIVYGSRVSLTVGVFGVLLAMSIGVTLGLLAGYFGGWIDNAVMAVVNILLSVPYLVLVIVFAAIFGRSLLNVVLIFGITDAPIFIRLTRGEVLRIKNSEYVQAARSLGGSDFRVIVQHVLPNLIGPLITLGTFELSAMIFYESGLSFLGLSVPPEVPSWGNLLQIGRPFLTIMPWLAIWPGVAIAITSLGINLTGDWLRDVIDPRTRRR